MVIYEVLSRLSPFAPLRGFTVMLKVLDGKRPERPRGVRGAWFQDNVWEMLERCWAHQPNDRPSLNAVLLCLQGATRPSGSSSHVDEDPKDSETVSSFDTLDPRNQSDASVSYPRMFHPPRPKFWAHPQPSLWNVRFIGSKSPDNGRRQYVFPPHPRPQVHL